MKILYTAVALAFISVFNPNVLLAQNHSLQPSGDSPPETTHSKTNDIDLTGVYTMTISAMVVGDETSEAHGIEYHSDVQSLNMMECIGASDRNQYETIHTPSINPLVRPKYITMANVLALSNHEAEAFFPIYARYESDLASLSNLTDNPDRVLEHQQTLREKYFEEMNKKSGSYLASRFLTWENYYANSCKVN